MKGILNSSIISTRVKKKDLKKFIDDGGTIDLSKDQGADVTACSSGKSFPNGMNALMYAIMKKKIWAVKTFLALENLDLLAKDNTGLTALHYAVGIPTENNCILRESEITLAMAHSDNLDDVFLYDSDPKVNEVINLKNLDPKDQLRITTVHSRIFWETQNGNEKSTRAILNQVLNKYKESNTSIDTIGAGRSAFGYTLDLALKTEFWRNIPTNDNKDTVVIGDRKHNTRKVFGQNKFDLAKMFIEANCDPNAKSQTSKTTPIEDAMAADLPPYYMEKITKSAGYADINGHGGNTLSTAIKSTAKKSPEKRRDSVDRLAVLVSNGYVPKNKKDANRLMNIGVEEQKPELVKVAQQSGANPYKPGIDGKSPAEKNNAIRSNDLFNFRVKVTSYFVFGASTGATFSLILIPIFLKASFLYDSLALSTYIFTLLGGMIGIAFACIKLPEHHDEEYEIDSSFSETSSISSDSVKQSSNDQDYSLIIRSEGSISKEKSVHSRNSSRNATPGKEEFELNATNVSMHSVVSNTSSN